MLLEKQKPAFALQAANVLYRLGEIARPSLPAMKQMLQAAPAKKGQIEKYTMTFLKNIANVLERREQALVYPTIR